MKRTEFLPYALPFIEEEEINEVVDAIKSNWLSKGPKTIEFEKRFAEYVGAKHAIAMNSCTAALHIALVANGIGEGDEVITTPLTFAASANTIIHTGAIPVFADIDAKTLCIDPSKIEEKITEKTKAIVPVHYGGQSCDLDRINEIAKKHNLLVLEDAAHAVYTTHKGKMIGSIGDTTSFSFYATKNICTGEGGMLTTNSDEIAEKARVMSLHGMSKNAWNRFGKGGSWFYEILYPGYKYNMTDMQAALGLCQLNKIEKMQNIRKEYADIYNDAFSKFEEIITPVEVEGNRHAWHLYVIRVKEEMLTIDRSKFIERLAEENIGTSVHYIPVHLHPYYAERFGYKLGDFPVAEKAYDGMISLPLYPSMKKSDVEDVINAVTRIIEENRK
ncbi:DegT/DnrJ/EryC1/StrS family aminotransferase [Clostridium cylindrosporum]|uniref:Spore coat polysaccharide biosynthesis protein SpsC n=1 Tax=Clostridium cylindrosporum DSM 605 TaxID=1121307 RepID=A0A0J8DEJ4_CLOCY|nr:DegT/DnrJ/EryC1/StrS family aminotransferase [Clostridium cylindrosporum]KMT22608.1 spore coat polysaccharide biosynthesis protein SpsC [Clostridium cylindrosporum DSM 605]